jgi:hypothetical protein
LSLTKDRVIALVRSCKALYPSVQWAGRPGSATSWRGDRFWRVDCGGFHHQQDVRVGYQPGRNDNWCLGPGLYQSWPERGGPEVWKHAAVQDKNAPRWLVNLV